MNPSYYVQLLIYDRWYTYNWVLKLEHIGKLLIYHQEPLNIGIIQQSTTRRT
jgi:hypothetical protein